MLIVMIIGTQKHLLVNNSKRMNNQRAQGLVFTKSSTADLNNSNESENYCVNAICNAFFKLHTCGV